MAEQVKEQGVDAPKSVDLNIRLAPIDNSDQPVLANFTRLNGAPGMVFVDFGFLEPAGLAALSRLAQTGGKIPENLNGKLAVRVALGYDTLAALHQQLGQVIDGLKAQQGQKAQAKK
jgi:DNA-binding LytR/AlgR family response regulator